jgi:predicted O-methyltransferase YrrM
MNKFLNLGELRKQMLKLPESEFWPVGPDAGHYIMTQVQKIKPQKILELGTSSGYSTTWIIQGLQGANSELITIESNKGRYEIAQKFFQKIDLQNIHLNHIRHHAPEVFEEIDLSNLDFIFCDAIKKQTLDLYLTLRPFMTPKSVFIVDNVISHKPSMQNLYDYLDTNKISYQVIEKGAGLIQIPYQ